MNYKAVTNCFTNRLFIEESSSSSIRMKNTDGVGVTLLLGSRE